MTRFVLSLFVTLFICNIFYAQTDVCVFCKKPITGPYIIVDGQKYHKEHFLCSECGRPIEGSYAKKGDLFFHPECSSKAEGLICAVCGKPITGKYITHEGKKYHSECYIDKAAFKCAVCGKPVLTEYHTDEFGNRFHSSHLLEYSQCSNCGRLICKSITGGGKKYPDGREICYLCSSAAVYENQIIRALFLEVKSRLNSLGINVPDNISVEGADRNELKRWYGGSVSNEMKGFCNSVEETRKTGSKIDKVTHFHKIYVLNGVPSIYLSATIAHELMHAWIYENAGRYFSAPVLEGSCNFAAYLYLKKSSDPAAAVIIRQFQNSPDEIYGNGFRMIFSRFADKPVGEFLTYLKKEGGKK
jgi:hypothetical protein